MTYIDTSSFLKLFLVEPESSDVETAVALIDRVVVSPLTVLEAKVQLRGLIEGGRFSRKFGTSVLGDMVRLIESPPFAIHKLGISIFDTALAQHDGTAVHCRSLDRLHLAAMEELGIKRLMTHDLRQADAARELGYEVVSPGLV